MALSMNAFAQKENGKTIMSGPVKGDYLRSIQALVSDLSYIAGNQMLIYKQLGQALNELAEQSKNENTRHTAQMQDLSVDACHEDADFDEFDDDFESFDEPESNSHVSYGELENESDEIALAYYDSEEDESDYDDFCCDDLLNTTPT